MNDFIKEMIVQLAWTIIKESFSIIIKLLTKKILQSKEKNNKELIMKKNVKKTTAKKRDNGLTGKFRDKTRGRISVHTFSCHDDVWQEMEAEKLKRNMSVGQYLNFLHDYYKQNEAKNRA